MMKMHTHRSRRRLHVLLTALLCVLGACTNSRDTAPSRPDEAPAAGDLTVVDEVQLSDRLLELTLSSPALEADTKLRLLLPADYANSTRDYPMLYLLHGCCDGLGAGYAAWTNNTDVEAFTQDLPLVVVMPDSGNAGSYSDWYNGGLGGAPRWETYHLRELLPWIERHYRVRRDRAGRMLAGLSAGGGGAFAYAAKYPDLFASAASYSGALDWNTLGGQLAGEANSALEGGAPASIWGLRATEEIRWRGHNSWDLAENLGNTQLFIRTGNGYEGGTPAPSFATENAVQEMSANMHAELQRLGIAHSYKNGEGAHTWPYWQEGLHTTLPQQLAYANDAVPEPSRFSYRSIDAEFSAFGWRVSMKRDVLEFVRLGDASAKGFMLSGSGMATVTTAPWYEEGRTYRVTTGSQERQVTADSDGRLTIAVDLGPSRQIQQYRAGSEEGYLMTVQVEIAP